MDQIRVWQAWANQLQPPGHHEWGLWPLSLPRACKESWKAGFALSWPELTGLLRLEQGRQMALYNATQGPARWNSWENPGLLQYHWYGWVGVGSGTLYPQSRGANRPSISLKPIPGELSLYNHKNTNRLTHKKKKARKNLLNIHMLQYKLR